ncbi:MAG: hypothetical protein ACYCUI_11115 [Vulcanimicrobiaceae bacterium]
MDDQSRLREELLGVAVREPSLPRRHFSFDPTLPDQRMNFLAYELATPIRLTKRLGNGTHILGRLYVRIYPSGFAVVQLSFSLYHDDEPLHVAQLPNLLQLVNPKNTARNPTWQCRLKQPTLQAIVELTYGRIAHSIYGDDAFPADPETFQPWHTSIRASGPATLHALMGALLPDLDSCKTLKVTGRAGEYFNTPAAMDELAFAPGLLLARARYNDRTALRFFWRSQVPELL